MVYSVSYCLFCLYLFGRSYGSSGFGSDKVCHLCLEFEAMSHGGTERMEDY